MYTRVNLRVRLFSFVISALFYRATLQTVGNHLVLRSGEEGDSVKPLYDNGLIKLHIVIFGSISMNSTSAQRRFSSSKRPHLVVFVIALKNLLVVGDRGHISGQVAPFQEE